MKFGIIGCRHGHIEEFIREMLEPPVLKAHITVYLMGRMAENTAILTLNLQWSGR